MGNNRGFPRFFIAARRQRSQRGEAGAVASVFKRRDTDMTEGSIIRLLVAFSVPLLIGNLFQQLYSTVDSVVVGNFVGKQALAAIGCTTSIINSLIGLFIGLSSGAGVVISQYYGAHEEDKLHRTVQTAIGMTFSLCVLLTALGVLLTPHMLRLMQTPEDVFDEAVLYLRIYFWGVTGQLVYNIGAGILRAVGDSTRPLYFLIFSTLSNTLLDILFVGVLRLGVAGAAYATILAQALSALLVMGVLARSRSAYRVDLGLPRVEPQLLRKICAIGIPTSLQMVITSVSNIFVQSYVNRFGSSAMAGWAAYVKIDGIGFLPITSLAIAMTTFVGQNLGARKIDRVKSAAPRCLGLATGIMIAVLTPIMVFAPQLVALFNREPEVIRYGTLFLRLISPFYMTASINQVYSGALRGAGNTRAPMLIMLFSFVFFRQIYLFTAYRLGGGVVPIGLGYPAGWVMCSVIMLIYYYTSGWLKKYEPDTETA